jgi:formylglycine-generating enzyme required for sulfatase activity
MVSFRICLIFFLVFLFAAHANAIEIPLEKQGGVYTLPVRINGVITLNFVLDSGAAEVSVPVDVVSTLLRTGTIKESDFLPGQVYSLADGSTLKSPRFLIRELEFGGIKISNVPASVAPLAGELLLGQSLLERLDSWSMDNRRHVLVLGEHVQNPVENAPASTQLKQSSPLQSQWKEPATGMEFIWVPGGCFQMGCGPWAGECYVDEVPVHEVCVDGFWMSKFVVTQGQWKILMGKNPSRFKAGDNYPVEQVSWNDTREFMARLNAKGGKQNGFRLPTEAEWEYAARSGGKLEKYAGGDDVGPFAWYTENSGKSTHTVGSKSPNGLGIYDMSGNVWEWCEDTYAWDAYTGHVRNNPVHQEGDANMYHVFRGGSWASEAYSVRTLRRGAHQPTHKSLCVGFRLVRVSHEPQTLSQVPYPSVSAKIISPKDGQDVSRKQTIAGVLSGLAPNQQAFLVIQSTAIQYGQKIYPQARIFPDHEGNWGVEGIYASTDFSYKTYVVFTEDPQAAMVLSEEQSRLNGLSLLPTGVAIISPAITVTRK